MEARGTFRLDRENRKMLGVCAGIARHFQIDVTLVRVAMVLAILMTFPVFLIAYFMLAAIAGRPASGLSRVRPPRRGVATTRQRLGDLDARLQAIESEIVGSRNSALAREIDALR